MKTLIVVDVESDGPCPGLYSMVCFGAVAVTRDLDKTFYGQTEPLSTPVNLPTLVKWDPTALVISGFTREQHLKFPYPSVAMNQFDLWLSQFEQPVFVSDNLAYDWQFINYYFHRFGPKGNPFGWSGRRIGDMYGGFEGDIRARWKQLRVTKHTHNPVDDAKGNAEALIKMADMGLKGIL